VIWVEPFLVAFGGPPSIAERWHCSFHLNPVVINPINETFEPPDVAPSLNYLFAHNTLQFDSIIAKAAVYAPSLAENSKKIPH
jgi:hypothetical protein